MELRDRGKSVSRAQKATCSGMRIVLRHSAGIRSARIFRDPRAQSSESATVTRILSIRRPSMASTRRVSRRYASVSPRRRKSFLISSISPASVSASPFASCRSSSSNESTFRKSLQMRRAVEQIGILGRLRVKRLLDVGLVRNLADDFFQNILQRDRARASTRTRRRRSPYESCCSGTLRADPLIFFMLRRRNRQRRIRCMPLGVGRRAECSAAACRARKARLSRRRSLPRKPESARSPTL